MTQNQLSHEEILAVLDALARGTLDQLAWLTETYLDAVDTIRVVDPEGVILAIDLATSGSVASRQSITASFHRFVLTQINATKMLEQQPGYEYDMFSIPSNSMVIHNEWLFQWSFYNVTEETGNDQLGLHPESTDLYSVLLPEMRVKHDATYWRGVAALLLSTNECYYLNLSFHEQFILWAGQYADINAVVTTARERGMSDPETLRHLVDEISVHSKLREGAL